MDDPKRAAIHVAAINEFSARGFAGTSMANIAEAAGMSRPALYQYFMNKADIFASAFVALMDDSVRAALAALSCESTTSEQLNGFLQRFDGDLWERMAASPHSDELLNSKGEHLNDEVAVVIAELSEGLDEFLEQASPGESRADEARRAGWADVLRLSPKGFKADQPSVETYRARLHALASSVAADIDATNRSGSWAPVAADRTGRAKTTDAAGPSQRHPC